MVQIFYFNYLCYRRVPDGMYISILTRLDDEEDEIDVNDDDVQRLVIVTQVV